MRQHILHDLTIEEVDDAVGKTRVALRVGHHDNGGAFFVEVGEQVHHLAAIFRVEVARRLVGEDELGVGDHGAGDGHPLLLTARELLREVVFAVLDGHARHDVVDTLFALGGGNVHVAQRQFDVLKHVEFVDEVEALEHEADVALAELGAVLLLEVLSKVDLPQPEGPMMATNSPLLISNETPSNAKVWIEMSSLTKTFLRFSTLIIALIV